MSVDNKMNFVGVFVRTFNLPAAQVTQTIYAHRTKTRLLINQITIRRKSGQTGNVTLTLTPNEGAPSEDINMQPDVNNDTFRYHIIINLSYTKMKFM